MKPQSSSSVPVKRITKAQRIKALAEVIFSQMLFAYQQKTMQSEQNLTNDQKKEVFNRAATAAINSAEAFDVTWQSQKGRFNEEPVD